MISYLHNIQKVSLIFFMIVGALHLSSGALFFNGEGAKVSEAIFRSSFIPFIICALSYAGSSIKINIYNFGGTDSKMLNYIFLAIGLVIVAALTIIFFTFPNL